MGETYIYAYYEMQENIPILRFKTCKANKREDVKNAYRGEILFMLELDEFLNAFKTLIK